MTSWREIRLTTLEGAETTLGREVDAARRRAERGGVAEAFDDILELGTTVDRMGRPHDALEILGAGREFLRQENVPAERWPWLPNAEGIAASHAGDADRAEAAYVQMRRLAEALPPGREREELVATAAQNLAILESERNPERAEPLLAEALQAKLDLGDLGGAADVLMSLGLNASALGDLERADKMLTDVVAIGETAGDARLLSAAYANRGGVRVKGGELDAAEDDFRRGLRHARSYGEPLRIVLALLNMGSLSRDRGRDGEAIRWYRRAVRAAEELGSPLQEVRVRRALALALHRRGRVAEARRELQQAGALARELGASQLEAGVRADVGAMYVEHGDVERGARELEQALAVFEATRDRHWLPITLQNLAEAMRLSARLAEADAYVRRGLAAVPETDHRPRSQLAAAGLRVWSTPPVHGARAAEYLRLYLDELRSFEDASEVAWRAAAEAAQLSIAGAPEASLSFFEEAVGAIEDDRLAWRARNDYAVALAAVGQHDLALEQLAWCLELGTSLDDRVLEQHARANLAEVLRRGDRHQEAEVHARSALELARDLMDRDAEASALGNLALTMSDLGRWDEARALYDEELAVALELGDSVGEAGALGGLAAFEFAAERPAEAAELYEQAARRDGGANRQQYVEDLGNALLAWTAAGRLRKLQGSAQRLVRAAERLGLERLGAEFLHRTAAMLLQRGERQAALNLFGGAVRLVASRAGRLYASDLEDAAETRPPADDGPDDDEFLVHLAQELTEPLGKLVLAVEQILETASDRERFYLQLVDELDEHIPGFGRVFREMLAAVREGLARAGVLPRGESATPSEPDGSTGD